jgi:hypothetical protein
MSNNSVGFVNQPAKSPKSKNAAISASKKEPIELTDAQKAKVFINLLASGISPEEALKGAQLDPLEDPLHEVKLEALLIARARNPEAKIYSLQECELLPDNFTRKDGELTVHELYDIIDFLYYSKHFPLTQIAKTLNLDVRRVALIKKNISEKK